MQILGPPPADAAGSAPGVAGVRPAAVTARDAPNATNGTNGGPVVSKDGSFMDAGVHCMAAVPRKLFVEEDLAAEVVTAA